jgi:hypothetical protein
MKIAIIDTYYPAFLAAHYVEHAGLKSARYEDQRQQLLDRCFGTSDFYSRHLNQLGCEAEDLIVNCLPLQEMWAKEHHSPYSTLAARLPGAFLRLPLVGRYLSLLPGLVEIAVAQVKASRPDILYCQDLSFFSPEVMARLRPYVKLIVGQIASPLPSDAYLKSYDLILTSFPHFVPRLRAMGVASEYFRIGFDPRVNELLGLVKKDLDLTFVGGISRHHGNAIPTLESLATHTPIQFFGYGSHQLDSGSPIRPRHHGEVWGLNMYRSLARSRITINRHINVAENYANNMRLYEATGVGAMLLTDKKDNLGDLFEIGKEVVAYTSVDEAIELIQYYLEHSNEANEIALAGQRRTLSEHTYEHRMKELLPLLDRYLSAHAQY